MKHIYGGNFNITEAEIKGFSNRITKVTKTANNIIVEHNTELTDQEDKQITDLLNSKVITKKQEYVKLTTDNERISFLAKEKDLV